MNNRTLFRVICCTPFISLLLTSCMQTNEFEPNFAIGDMVSFRGTSAAITVRYVGMVMEEQNGLYRVEIPRNGHEQYQQSVWLESSRLYGLSSNSLQDQAEIPSSYYLEASSLYPSSTLSRLEEVLQDFVQRFSYELDIYDCSNMTAYLEQFLENEGFNAWMRTGPTPWDPANGYHAWVIVYTVDGFVVPVEATHRMFSPARVPGIVYSDSSRYLGYVEGFPEEGHYYDYDSIYSYAHYLRRTEYVWWWWMD